MAAGLSLLGGEAFFWPKRDFSGLISPSHSWGRGFRFLAIEYGESLTTGYVENFVKTEAAKIGCFRHFIR